MEETLIPKHHILYHSISVTTQSTLIWWFNTQKNIGFSIMKYPIPLHGMHKGPLKENGSCILPLEHMKSSEGTVRGSCHVDVGDYTLMFDNTHGRNATKITYFVTIKQDGQDVTDEMVASGILLKKKKKALQGYARRYFTLSSTGILSYAVGTTAPIRDALQVASASISLIPQRWAIHIDSGAMLWHLKAMNKEDYDTWERALRRFKGSEEEMEAQVRKSMEQHRDTLEEQETQRDALGGLGELDEIRRLLMVLAPDGRTDTMTTSSLKSTSMPITSERKPSGFKLRMSKNNVATAEVDSTASTHSAPNLAMTAEESVVNQIRAALEVIRTEFASMQDQLQATKSKVTDLETLNAHLSAENMELRRINLAASMVSGTVSANTFRRIDATIRAESMRHMRQDSMASIMSAADFFDAPDIIVAEPASSEDEEDALSVSKRTKTPSDVVSDIVEEEERNEDAQDEEEIGEERASTDILTARIERMAMPIQRRRQLPAPVAAEEVSFISILRKNIGKDLSSVAMPVSLNEPLNLLQRMAEDLEYSDLLDKAAEAHDPADRMMMIAAFLVSGYASSQYRTGRKPFNPLHGETYELHRPDKGFQFISEKVSHQPPIMACHAVSPNYEFWQDSRMKTKFWGKSMEFTPIGKVNIVLRGHNDERYSYTKPTTWMKNMIAGYRYLEHAGDVRIQNHTTGHYCTLSFKESGMFTSGKNEVTGSVHAPDGKRVRVLSGRWTEVLFHEVSKDRLEVLWRASPPPPNHELQYGFTHFAIELNEITPDIEASLPHTDTRLRPDQRLYEHGQVDEADDMKQKLEEAQRQRRREMEERGISWMPQWFELAHDPHLSEPVWTYRGGYWEAREKGEFPKHIQLW